MQHPPETRHALRLLATKQTIFAGILLHHLIHERGPDFAESLVERAMRFSEDAAHRSAEFRANIANGRYPPAQSPGATTSSFFKELDISPMDLEMAQAKTEEALSFLEDEDLILDPAFTPELMVLAGLIPMHFSVRTPKGERVYREIKVNAALWSLDITRGNKNGRLYTDIEFRIRGIKIVRPTRTTSRRWT